MNPKQFIFLIISVLSFCYSTQMHCQEGNYKYDNYGSRSILLSGSVTGSVEDLELTYYNPAKLGLIDAPLFSINAKAYQQSKIKISDAFGRNSNLESSNFQGLPTMFVITFNLKFLEGHEFAYSALTKTRNSINLGFDSGLIIDDLPDLLKDVEIANYNINLNNDLKEEWFGLTWAKAIDSTFSVGISGFLSTYKKSAINNNRVALLSSNDEVVLYNQNLGFRQKSVGLFWKVGAAWKLKKLDLGLNISLPYLEITNDGRFNYEELLAGLGSGSDRYTLQNFRDLEAKRKIPLSVALGAGIPFGKNKISANIEWYNGVSNYDRIAIPQINSEIENELSFTYDEELKSIINFAIGAEIYISPKLYANVGFSTDFSAYEESPNIFDLINQTEETINIVHDYYHLGVGGELKLDWVNLILGTNFTTSSSSFKAPNLFQDEIDSPDENHLATVKISRFQFIIGIDIPFLNRKLKSFKPPSSEDNNEEN
jgi:hypothetical protein